MENQFHNPIMPGADPFVLLHEGVYYMYCTMENDEKLMGHNDFYTAVGKQDGYMVYVSEDLQTWENKGFCLTAEDVQGDKWFWAPEIMHKDGKFYMVYSSEEHIGMAVADSPLGPFKQAENAGSTKKRPLTATCSWMKTARCICTMCVWMPETGSSWQKWQRI